MKIVDNVTCGLMKPKPLPREQKQKKTLKHKWKLTSLSFTKHKASKQKGRESPLLGVITHLLFKALSLRCHQSWEPMSIHQSALVHMKNMSVYVIIKSFTFMGCMTAHERKKTKFEWTFVFLTGQHLGIELN